MGPQRETDCLDACVETAKGCLRTLKYCLRWGGALAETGHLLTLLDCAHSCRLAAERVQQGDVLADHFLACADACERCARACDPYDDLELRECAELCRYCAPVCRRAALER